MTDLPPQAPVFPLPSLVFFPETSLPLHIFEPRYRKMVRDIIDGDGIIAMALLKPGWEPEYYGSPAVRSLGCAGRLIDVTELADGRYNIKLRGVCRVVFGPFISESPYRIARIKPRLELVPADTDPGVHEAKLGLVGAYAMLVTEMTGQPATGLEGATSMGIQALVNLICAQIDLPVELKQKLLDMDDILERCRAVTGLVLAERNSLGNLQQSAPGRRDDSVH